MTTMRQLYDLQELDWEIDHSQAELASIEARLHDDPALVKARAEMAEKEDNLRQLRRRHADHSQEAQQLQEKARVLDQRLYGGSVRNPRELEGLESELQYAKEHAAQEEEELLNVMIGLDEKERLVTKARMELEQKEKAWAEAQATLTKERVAVVKRLQSVGANREQLTAAVASPLLTQYEQLRKIRHGHAVAKVERGMCMGCRITLPTKELQRVRMARDPVVCSSCGRILYAS